MPERLTRKDVDRIAMLARLELSDAEKDLFVRQLTEVLEYADQIQAIDTTDVPPTSHVLSRLPVDRADEPQPGLTNAEALGNAPDPSSQTGLFRVPRVIGGSMPEPSVTTARDIREAVSSGRTSAVEVCQDALSRIESTNPALNAFLAVQGSRALERARVVDREQRHAPLAGVPVAVKDNILTRGIVTTAASRTLEHFLPPYDATVITRLEAAGAVVMGKTNCDEFAMGSSTENSAFGPSRNPWNTEYISGGSSGGSAVAVAAGMSPIALGSDTGGSIRQPASLCGIVGLKPTYGRVSRYGLIAFASSLDQIGPLTRTAYDAALALSVLAGPDARDATAAQERVPDYTSELTGDVHGLRLGVPRKMLEQGVDDCVRECFYGALEIFRARGAEIVDIELPHARYAISTYYIVATAEASSNLARYDGVRFGFRAPGVHDLREMYEKTRSQGFGAEVKRRIMLGTYVLSAGYYDAYYLKAQRVRTLVRRDYEQAFQKVDAVVMPTSPTPAFRIGDRVEDPLQLYLVDIFTVSANLAGLPALSVPCGLTPDRLPIGLQLTGKPFDEATLLRIGDAYERDTNWWKECPAI